MSERTSVLRPDRHPSESYEDILGRDTRPAPEILREGPVPDLGTEAVAACRYYDRGFFDREVARVWRRTWQFACREEEIPAPGDYLIYELVGKSLIIARTAGGQIKAFYNSCLHRGRKLVTADGCRAEFRCPFHGMSWWNDGRFKANPISWDLPQWRTLDMRLPEATVGTWGGFVFVNFDPAPAPLEQTLGPLIEHFRRWVPEECHKVAHVAKVIRANWKVVAEAFMESHHTVATHPQLLPYLADVNSQYDMLSDYVTRQFSAVAVASPLLSARPPSATEIYKAMLQQGAAVGSLDESAMTVPDGQTARQFAADQARRALTAQDGYDYSQVSDAELLDPLLYNVWPNFSVWGGYLSRIVYRWRPNGTDPESTIMDVLFLKRMAKGSPRARPPSVHKLGADEPWTLAPELGGLVPVLEQDMGNLPYIQEGLRSSRTGVVHFGRYSEMRIRQLHRMLDRFMDRYPDSPP